MPRQYLKDASLNAQLEKEGYVAVRMLSDESIETLTSKFSEAHDEDKIVPFYATAHHQDTDFREQMGDAILKELKPAVDETFIDCELLGGSFIVKTKSDQSLLQPHQDGDPHHDPHALLLQPHQDDDPHDHDPYV